MKNPDTGDGWRQPCLTAVDDGNGSEETVSMRKHVFVERVMFRKEKVFFFPQWTNNPRDWTDRVMVMTGV